MTTTRDDTDVNWVLIAHAASVVATRHGLSLDEATQVLHYEAGLVGRSVDELARIVVSYAE